jgi:hypothetical protein
VTGGSSEGSESARSGNKPSSSLKGKIMRRLSAHSSSAPSVSSSNSSQDTMASSVQGSTRGRRTSLRRPTKRTPNTSPSHSPIGSASDVSPPRRRLFNIASEVESGQITSASAAAARVEMGGVSPPKSRSRGFRLRGPSIRSVPGSTSRMQEQSTTDGHSIAGVSVGGDDPELEVLAQEAELRRLLEQSTIALEAIQQSRDDFARRVDAPEAEYALSPVIEVD